MQRVVYLDSISRCSQFETAMVNAGPWSIAILSPYPPYKPVTPFAMTQSAKNKIIGELSKGYKQLHITLAQFKATKGEIQRSVQATEPSQIYRPLFLLTSELTHAEWFIMLRYETFGSQKAVNPESTKSLHSRHQKMVGFVESRLTSLVS